MTAPNSIFVFSLIMSLSLVETEQRRPIKRLTGLCRPIPAQQQLQYSRCRVSPQTGAMLLFYSRPPNVASKSN